MMNKYIIPWRRGGIYASPRANDPFTLLHKEMNDLFDGFLGESTWNRDEEEKAVARREWFTTPRVDVSETDKEIQVSTELPGIDEKDVKITVDRKILTIEAEKKDEKAEEKDRQYHITEMRYGKFSRSFRLPENRVDEENIKAAFDKGVLTVTLPKREPTPEAKRTIEIQSGK
ncbi:MAG: Hsp20/alpha crystallin family protein [Kiritimatiellae bacterium]|nr:Hsp20/alpha crystallin family protein [Kiritimatiellia bacterium]